jgi:hypothetical protein
VFEYGFNILALNFISSLAYFGLCGLGIFTYFFWKEKKIPKLIDSKLGLADIIICLTIGVSFSFISLILFFTVAFVLSAIAGLIFFRNRTIPLAGILVILYLIFIWFSPYFDLDLMF